MSLSFSSFKNEEGLMASSQQILTLKTVDQPPESDIPSLGLLIVVKEVPSLMPKPKQEDISVVSEEQLVKSCIDFCKNSLSRIRAEIHAEIPDGLKSFLANLLNNPDKPDEDTGPYKTGQYL